MNTSSTQKTAQNYQLITINRYGIAESEVHVVTHEFLKNWLKLMKSNEIETLFCRLVQLKSLYCYL